MTNFTIENNQGIRDFLEGSDKYIPTSEVIYLHTHPLVKPNFILQVSDMLEDIGNRFITYRKLTDKIAEELINYAVELEKSLPEINEKNAEKACKAIRNIYTFCKKYNDILPKATKN